jgi:hypothetical protein
MMAAKPDLESLSLEELQTLIADAQKVLAAKVDAERSTLLQKLSALDAISKPAHPLPKKTRAPRKKQFRHPDGREFAKTSDNIPAAFRELGVMDWAEMEKYKIQD